MKSSQTFYKSLQSFSPSSVLDSLTFAILTNQTNTVYFTLLITQHKNVKRNLEINS